MSATRVPGAANATVAPEKARDYLLAADHPDNAGKAAFFFLFGFTSEQWTKLQLALAAHPANNVVVGRVPAGDGMRYRVRCNCRPRTVAIPVSRRYGQLRAASRRG